MSTQVRQTLRFTASLTKMLTSACHYDRFFQVGDLPNQTTFHNKTFPEHQQAPRHDWYDSAHEFEVSSRLGSSSTPSLCSNTVSAYQHPMYTHECADDGDPLQDDSRLLKGLRITESDENDPTAVKKVPSEQALSKFRWGSHHRTSGRSRSGLQIQVPGRKILLEPIVSATTSGKSIIYTYESSSSSSGRTTQSFGAIGDHLPSARSALLSSNTMLDIPENFMIRPSLKTSTSSNTLSPLGNLVLESLPDEGYYKLLAVGEVGPTRKNIVPHVVDPSRLVPQRRRSLSDLIEPPALVSSHTSPTSPRPAADRLTAQNQWSRSNATQFEVPDILSQLPAGNETSGEEIAPLWYRSGPPYDAKAGRGNGARVPLDLRHGDLDPAIFSLPYGVSARFSRERSLILMCKTVKSFHYEVHEHIQSSSFCKKRSVVFHEWRK